MRLPSNYQPDISNPFHKEPSRKGANGGSSNLELVGTVEYPKNTLHRISWSPDGRFFATFTVEQVCLWQLPGKSPLESKMQGDDEKQSNKNASSLMKEEVEITKVGEKGVVLRLLSSEPEVSDG
jgi:hypothetical protein